MIKAAQARQAIADGATRHLRKFGLVVLKSGTWGHFENRLASAEAANREAETAMRACRAELDQVRAQLLASQQQLLEAREQWLQNQRQLEQVRLELAAAKASELQTAQQVQSQLAEALATLAQLKIRVSQEQAARQALHDRLTSIAGLPLPVYVTNNLRPSAQPKTGSSPHRTVICSLPKAGTYFVGELLHLLGCEPTRLHLSIHGLSDYRQASIKEMREEYQRYSVDLPLPRSLPLILPGQFAVGHLDCTAESRSWLAPFKKIFVYRDLRDALVSFMRFYNDTQRGGPRTQTWKGLPEGPDKMREAIDHMGQEFFAMCHPMADWLDQPDVLKISFEVLYGDFGEARQQEAIQSVHQFLEIPGELGDLRGLLERLVGAPTKTWSGARSRRDIYWNDEVEARFRQLRGHELNARLGYA